MPTPSEPTIPQTLHSEPTSRTSFTSCPPEDDRDFANARETRLDRPSARSSTASTDSDLEEHAIARQASPSADDQNESIEDSAEDNLQRMKVEHVEDVNVTSDTASAAASPEASSDYDSVSAHAHEHSAQPAYYLDHLAKRQKDPSITTSFLRPGSRFHGTQRSDRQVYDVQVEIKDVDLAESFICGYLRIQGLTDDHPTLTTFFEGEIIGPKHLFKTTHPSWGSTEKVDLQHWARFPAWRPLAKSAKSPSFTLKNFQQREHLFMRWKEYFLVPDHRVKTITGASFEGFYYICFNQCDGRVSGIYFHAKSEKYQQLELQHIEDHGCQGAMEFR